MKSNEAPEKIYLEWYRIGDKKYREWRITPQTNDEPVEYTRTDALIEKACDTIKELLSGYIIRNFHFGDSYDMDKLVEDFRNYMKG